MKIWFFFTFNTIDSNLKSLIRIVIMKLKPAVPLLKSDLQRYPVLKFTWVLWPISSIFNFQFDIEDEDPTDNYNHNDGDTRKECEWDYVILTWKYVIVL